jgi:hypothetical protein
MTSTTDRAAVTATHIEQQLTDLLLSGRDSLPHGANGHPKAPPAAVASTRKLLRQGLRVPFRHLVQVSTADLSDGVPLSEVLAPYHRMIAYLESRAAEQYLARREKPVAVLMQRTQKEAGDLSLAMLRLAHSPASVDAMDAVIREAADLPPVVNELRAACHLSVVRTSTAPTRRPTMELSR